jgi:hypothetical protein
MLPLLVMDVLPTTPIASPKSVLQTAQLLLQDTPSLTVLSPPAQIQQHHAQEVSYQLKFYSPQEPP